MNIETSSALNTQLPNDLFIHEIAQYLDPRDCQIISAPHFDPANTLLSIILVREFGHSYRDDLPMAHINICAGSYSFIYGQCMPSMSCGRSEAIRHDLDSNAYLKLHRYRCVASMLKVNWVSNGRCDRILLS